MTESRSTPPRQNLIKRLEVLEKIALIDKPLIREAITALSETAPKDALSRIAKRLRMAGATLPAPEPKGTVDSAITAGLCIALSLVETEIENAAPGCGGQASGRTLATTSSPADEHSPESASRCVAAAPDAYIVVQAHLVIHDGFAINKVAVTMARELVRLGER